MSEVDFNSFLFRPTLVSRDPKDLWFSSIGRQLRTLYFKNRILGVLPVGLAVVLDHLAGSILPYSARAYPISHAFNIMVCIARFVVTGDIRNKESATNSLDWLLNNSCSGYSGYCWGTGNPRVTKNATYDENVPYATITPYVVEALLLYRHFFDDKRIDAVLQTTYKFFVEDLVVLNETSSNLVLSYAPTDERLQVYNSNSYCLYMHALFLRNGIGSEEVNRIRVNKLFNALKEGQQPDGFWYYYTDVDFQGNFIDCFHTVFILKNLWKTSKLTELAGVDKLIDSGHLFLRNFQEKNGLYKQFYKSDKYSLLKFDLYDQAEMLNWHLLRGELVEFDKLDATVISAFGGRSDEIYSHIDLFGFKKNRNTLRWAVFPYLHAVSQRQLIATGNEESTLHAVLLGC
ncbi:MAG: hypothetical protein GC178_09910 [Flavobacteriales bacterium]|nr:hypothetical protein [Flavobacteriales bacterium]